MNYSRPSQREDFEIAIICALPLEYNAVSSVFEEFFDEDGDPYGRAEGDPNIYTTGLIGKHNVVLALLCHMGKSHASSAAASIGMSYTRLRIALLVGICGGVPRVGIDGADEILLGDVIISKSIVQYDYGRLFSHKFVRKNTADDNPSKQNKYVRNVVAQLETDRGRSILKKKAAHFLKELQTSARSGKYNYPGAEEDKLFESSYCHRHYIYPKCACREYGRMSSSICDDALNASCKMLGCDESHLVRRKRLEQKLQLEIDEAQVPAIFVGSVATGDKVMKSAEDRDRIANTEGIIAFEMEAAGVWEDVPCIVIKGVCDYADSHKNKKWQDFAAATAAATMKALLERIPQTEKWKDGRREVAVNTMMAQKALNQLPAHLIGRTPVVVMDARDKPLRLDLDTIQSLEVFTEILKDRFKDLGQKKIIRGEWFLHDHYSGQILDMSKPWGALMRPGRILDMTMIFRRRNAVSIATQCPNCQFNNIGDYQTQVRCKNCQINYRRIEEIKDIDVLEEVQSTQNSQASLTSTSSSSVTTSFTSSPNSKNEKLPTDFPRPRPPPKPQAEEDDLGSYSRIQIIDTNFRIQKVQKVKALPGMLLTPHDLKDLERLAAYLAEIYGLPEEDCLGVLQDSVPHLHWIVEEVRVATNSERPELKALQRERDEALRVEPENQSTPDHCHSRADTSDILYSHNNRIAKQHQRVAGTYHSPDTISPAGGALLAMTPLPSQTTKSGKSQHSEGKRQTADERLRQTWVLEEELRFSLRESPLDILLSPPYEDSSDIETSPVSESLKASSTGSQTRRLPSRKMQRLTAVEDSSEDHPLSMSEIDIDEIDFRVFQQNTEKSSQQRSSFKSSLEASLRALKSAAASISSPKPPLIPPDDFLISSNHSSDPKALFGDENMSSVEDIPAPAPSIQLTTRKPL